MRSASFDDLAIALDASHCLFSDAGIERRGFSLPPVRINRTLIPIPVRAANASGFPVIASLRKSRYCIRLCSILRKMHLHNGSSIREARWKVERKREQEEGRSEAKDMLREPRARNTGVDAPFFLRQENLHRELPGQFAAVRGITRIVFFHLYVLFLRLWHKWRSDRFVQLSLFVLYSTIKYKMSK